MKEGQGPITVSEATASYVAQICLRDPVAVAFLENHLRDAHGIVLGDQGRAVFKFTIEADILEPDSPTP